MATTTTTTDYNGNGSLTTYNFSFPYLKTEDVKVSLNGTNLETTKYTVSGTTLTFASGTGSTTQETTGAPKSGVTVLIYRDTNATAAKAIFASGSSFRATDLNNNKDQSLYFDQEMSDTSNPKKSNFVDLTVTGDATVPTQSAGDNTTKVATTAFVKTAVDNLIDGAPGSLDTLNELAASLNDDANLSTTLTNSIATKLPLGGGQMTGNITFSGSQTVDGRDLSADGSKLDAIEASAKDDQTAAEIKTLLNSNGIVNAQVDASAAIAGTKISPDFGSQAITTTGDINGKDLILSDTHPAIKFIDSNHNSDYKIYINNGLFEIRDETNDTNRFKIASNGTVEVAGNLDVGAGLDVTGTIAATGDISATGNLSGKDLLLSDTNPAIKFTDSDSDPDYLLLLNNGRLVLRDISEDPDADRFAVASDGHIDVYGNLDCLAGVDITGNITVTGTQEFTLPSGSNKGITLNNPTNAAAHIIADAARTGGGQNILAIRGKYAGTEVSKIVLNTSGSTSSKGGTIEFHTSTENSGSLTERLKITSDGNIQIDNDSGKLQLGASQDLKLYHDGTSSYIVNNTGNLHIRNSGTNNIKIQPDPSDVGIVATANAAVELYWDGTKKFQTTSDGVQVLGKLLVSGTSSYLSSSSSTHATLTLKKNNTDADAKDYLELRDSNNDLKLEITGSGNVNLIDSAKLQLGDSQDLEIYHNANDGIIRETERDLFLINTVANGQIIQKTDGNWLVSNQNQDEYRIKAFNDGAVELYYDDNLRIQTSANGTNLIGDLYFDNSSNAGKDILWDQSANYFKFTDNVKAVFGNGVDLEIYHDGSNSYIKDSGTGALGVLTNHFFIADASNADYLFQATDTSDVKLYYDGSLKLATTSTGATVVTTNAANSIKNITTSTSAPSGGSDGDLWFTYVA